MMTLRRRINLFYYNIFRFERYTQYLVCYPLYGGAKLMGLGRLISTRSGIEKWDEYLLDILNDAEGGISLHVTGIHVCLLVLLVLLTFLNVICGLFELGLQTFWFYGMVTAAIFSVAISFYAAPTDKEKYLKDFRRFESQSKSEKRKYAFVTFVIIIGIWILFVLSSIYYMRLFAR
jgi:hypothetical protein